MCHMAFIMSEYVNHHWIIGLITSRVGWKNSNKAIGISKGIQNTPGLLHVCHAWWGPVENTNSDYHVLSTTILCYKQHNNNTSINKHWKQKEKIKSQCRPTACWSNVCCRTILATQEPTSRSSTSSSIVFDTSPQKSSQIAMAKLCNISAEFWYWPSGPNGSAYKVYILRCQPIHWNLIMVEIGCRCTMRSLSVTFYQECKI